MSTPNRPPCSTRRRGRDRSSTAPGRSAAGGDAAVVEPATGDELERIGIADAEDVARSAALAADAQREWAAQPFLERAAVLRRAGGLFEEHAEEIQSAGSSASRARSGPRPASRSTSPPRSAYEAADAALAAAGRDHPQSEQQRLSLARRDPGRRGRRHRAVQRAADPVDPLRRAGARARQRGAAQARPAHGGVRRRVPGPRSSRRPACPRACCTCCPAAPRPARRWWPSRGCGHLVHRVHRGRAQGRRGGGPAPQARAPRAGRQLGASSCSTMPTSTRRSAPRRSARSSTRARSA